MLRQDLTARRHTLATWDEAQEFLQQEGCTGGLPVVPPTEERVQAMLDYLSLSPSEVLAREATRGKVFTAEKVAINAVMAGCLPEYMPVLVSALQGMVEHSFNLYASTSSTNGTAPLLVVSGPITQRLGMNGGFCLFGPGPRANAALGRAVSLMMLNLFGAQPDVLDKSTISHPGKYTYCIAENEAVLGEWEPLRVEKGFPREASTVTVLAAMGPWEVDDHTSNTPEDILTSIAFTALGLGPGQTEVLVILSPEHLFHIHRYGWSRGQVRQYLFQRAALPLREWQAWGKLRDIKDRDPQEMVPMLGSAEGITLVTAGGGGGGFSAFVQGWTGSRSATKAISEPS